MFEKKEIIVPILISEIKAKCKNIAQIRNKLQSKGAWLRGIDHQVDTYFKVNSGRLKLREGEIENNLIHYHRENQAGPKQSQVTLFQSQPKSNLKEILRNALGVLAVVDKQREIYFIENVKFHLDEVQNLGSFVEIEAIDKSGALGEAKLLEQCYYYLELLGIQETELISVSYSDLVLAQYASDA